MLVSNEVSERGGFTTDLAVYQVKTACSGKEFTQVVFRQVSRCIHTLAHDHAP
jgi:hypothetical protein